MEIAGREDRFVSCEEVTPQRKTFALIAYITCSIALTRGKDFGSVYRLY